MEQVNFSVIEVLLVVGLGGLVDVGVKGSGFRWM